MNDHDLTPDLEALLADAATGDLGPEDAESLRAAITERPWLADLVDEQRIVASRLDPGPAAGLTDLERARLRRSVLDEVAGADPAPAISPSPRPMPWARWAFAAAAAVVVVVVASVGLLSGRLGGDSFTSIGSEITSLPAESDDRAAADTEEDAMSEAAAVPEADLGAGDEAADTGDGSDIADGAGESPLATPQCAAPGRSIDGLVGRIFADPDDARVAAESLDPIAFSGEPEPIDGPGRITWVWEGDTDSVTGILEVVAEDAEWRVERAETCG